MTNITPSFQQSVVY